MAEVRAAVRIRPAARSGAPSLSIKGQYGQFAFDYVIEENASQEAAFSDVVWPSVEQFLQGSSSVVMCYGAAQSGKTFTLEGGTQGSRREGLIPRAMLAIFKNLASVPKHRYKIYVTYCALSAGMEAQMVDLLAPGSPPVPLKEVSATSALARLLHYQAESYEDIFEVLRHGRMTRVSAFTGSASSPSGLGAGGGASLSASRTARPLTAAAHVMLNIQLTGFDASGKQLATNLTFVELAAPEPKDIMGYPAAPDSGLTRSLSLAYASLTAVLAALRSGGSGGASRGGESPTRGHSHVPWRDSPLTRWLKGCLTEASSVLVIATVAPGPEAATDTLATLSFANRLRSGPKSDGLLVTATWDAPGGTAPGFEAAAEQQELARSLQDSLPRDRFGSPIQVRSSPASAAASSLQHADSGSYSPPTQRAPSLDTRYGPADSAGPAHRERSASQPAARPSAGGASALGSGGGAAPPLRGAQSMQATPSSATPTSNRPQSPLLREPDARGPPASQRASEVFAQPAASGSALRGLSASMPPPSTASQPASHGGAQRPPLMPGSRSAPLSDLLASMQLGSGGGGGGGKPGSGGGAAPPPGARSDAGAQPRYDSGVGGEFGSGGGGVQGAGSRGGAAAGGGAGGGVADALSRQVEALRWELDTERRERQRLQTEVAKLEAANRSAADVAETQAALSAAELRAHADSLRKQLDASEASKQALSRKVQQLTEAQGGLLDLQAESSVLEAQVRALQDSLDAARTGQASASAQLAEAKAAAEQLRAERDRVQRQNHELSDKLQAQVRKLTDETARLRAQSLEAAAQVEAEQVARRAAEAALAALRVQVESSRGAEGSAMQQAAAFNAQTRELERALEAVRAERNKLQEAKWRADERAEQLGLQVEAAATAAAKADMEARAAAMRAESDLRSAIMVAEGLKVELAGARTQLESLKQELKSAQAAVTDAARRENGASMDVQEMEALMREMDRDLEVQANATWRQLRAERADSLFGVPDAGSVAPARRWRPVVQALVGVIKRNATEAERQAQALEQARERMAALEVQAGRAGELAAALSAHQGLKSAQLAELDENRRGVALLDQALGEANRECERLHRQLEELTAAHKALAAESRAREERLQAQAGEREAELQAQLAEREERLRALPAEHDRRLQAVTDEWAARLRAEVAERDGRLAAAAVDADASRQAAAAERSAAVAAVAAEGDARLAAAVAEGEAKFGAAVAEADAMLRQVAAEAETRYREAVAERDARLAALGSERDALQRQVSSLSALQDEDKQERDVLRLKAHARDQLLHIVWSEARAAKLACMSGGASPPRSPLGPSGAPSPPHSLSTPPSGMELVPAPGGARAEAAALDWGEPVCQERLLKGLTTVRVQVGKLQADLGALRAGAALAEDLSTQLAAARQRGGEAQRSAEAAAARAAGLESDLRDEQAARSTLQGQLAAAQAAAAEAAESLAEVRGKLEALQEEAALLAKSRDTWKDTATQQEAQLRELYSESESRANELSRLRGDAQTATAEASGATARLKMLESQLQDAQSQVETLTARLSATDRALGDANTRAASLNGQLVLADSEAKLKAAELLSRVQAAEDAAKLAKANAKDAADRLEGRLREASEQGARLVAELDALRAERNDAQHKADELQRELLEARARVSDAEHTARQLQRVVLERDSLQEQLNAARNAHAQASEEARSLRRQLDAAHDQLARVGDERTRLAAQLEGQRLSDILAGMAPRTGGRIGALARGGGEAAGGLAAGGGAEGGGGGAGRAPAMVYPRVYGGAGAYAAPGPSAAYGGPSVGASPTVARAGLPGYGMGAAPPPPPYSPIPSGAAAGGLAVGGYEHGGAGALGGAGLRLGAPPGGYGVGGDDGLGGGIRVHVRASPPQGGPIGLR